MTKSLLLVEKAKHLRLQGASYSEIKKEVGVAKSTLSLWLKDVPHPKHLYYTNQKEWLQKIRLLASEKIRNKREHKINMLTVRVKEEVQTWTFFASKEVQKVMLSLLYWTEGQKLPERTAPVKFANTDPRLVLLFVTLFKNCYTIDPKKIKIKLHLHWYHNEKDVKEYWKQLLGIEESQFRKIYRKKRSITKRFRKNFMGICFVIYQSVDLRHEIVQTAFAVQKQVLAALRP